MKRVYVAGAYAADNVLQVLENIRRGQRASVEVLLAGYAPFCPWLDHQFYFQLREGESIPIERIREYSLAWLPACEAVLVLPGWENSKGTKAEIARAEELGIPVLFSLEELLSVHSC